MIRSLSEAVLRTQLRRLRGAALRRRPVAVASFALWLIAPVAAWRLGRSVGGLLSEDAVTLTVARGLVLGLAVACAAAGAASGATIPGCRALGPQVAAAPVSRTVAAIVLALPVVAGAAVLVGPTLFGLAAALAAASPGGAGAAVSLTVSFLAAAASGAVAVESGLRLVRRGGSSTRAVAAVATATIAVLIAIEGAARALARGGPFLLLSAVACALAAAGACSLWVALAATRPEPRVAAARRPLVAPQRRPVAAASCAAFALLSRAPELRAALVAAASFGLVGLGAGLAAGAPPGAALLLGGGACVLAAALVPLAVRGRLDPGAWVWRAGPRHVVAGAWAASSLSLVLLTLLPVGLIVLARPQGAAAAAQVAAVAVGCWAAALIAGAVVPRRAAGAGDDALSLGAFAIATVALGAVATLAGPALGKVGVPDAIAALLVLAAASAAAVTLLGASWGSA